MTYVAVLFSALIQAGWNYLAKKSIRKPSMLILCGWFLSGLVFVPFAHIITGTFSISETAVFFILGSSAIHVVYILLLGAAYQSGDLSIVYPLSRGGGIAWTSLFVFLLGEVSVSMWGGLGILLVIAASVIMVSGELGRGQNARLALKLAAVIGVVIGIYSVVDSRAVKFVDPVVFLAWINLISSLMALPFVWARNRSEILLIMKSHKKEAVTIAAGGALAYLIILYAYRLAPAPYVVALREVSVFFAAALGFYFLKEQPSRRKIAGVAMIAGGAILIRLA